MSLSESVHQRLGEWLDGISLPALDDPNRRIEELRLGQLRNFLLLLLARFPNDLATTPAEALERCGPELTELSAYQQTLSLPFNDTPDGLATALKLGKPRSELFTLQENLLDQLDDDGHRLIVELGRLF